MNSLYTFTCKLSRALCFYAVGSIDPLHIMGMQPIWGAKQMKLSLLGIEILLFCPPDWLHSHRRAYKVCLELLSYLKSHIINIPCLLGLIQGKYWPTRSWQ